MPTAAFDTQLTAATAATSTNDSCTGATEPLLATAKRKRNTSDLIHAVAVALINAIIVRVLWSFMHGANQL